MYSSPRHPFWKKLLTSKLALVVVLILVILIGYSIIKEKKNQQQTVDAIASLKQEIQTFENRNLELVEMVKYLRSNQFIEKEARQKLGLQQPGEKVVIIPALDQGQVAGAVTRALSQPNYVKWWKYFFE
jgi:cell division protein FtsB